MAVLLGLVARLHGADPGIPGLRDILRPWSTNLATISPNGRYLAYPVLEETGADQLIVIAVDEPHEKAELELSDVRGVRPNIRILSLRWAGSDHLVAETDDAVILIVEVPGHTVRKLVGAEDVATNHFQFNPALRRPPTVARGFDVAEMGGDAAGRDKTLRSNILHAKIADSGAPFTSDPKPPKHPVRRYPQLVPADLSDDGSVLVEALGFHLERSPFDVPTELFRVRLKDGQLQSVTSGCVDGTVLWDRQGHPRILEPSIGSPNRTFRYSLSPNRWDQWNKMDAIFDSDLAFELTPENYEGPRSFPVAFGNDANVVYYASNTATDTLRLYPLNVTTKWLGPSLAGSPTIDIAAPESTAVRTSLVSDRRGRLVGVRSVGLNPSTEWLDPQIAGVQSALEAQFVHRFVQVIDWDDANNRYLALISSNQDPGRYVVYDRTSGRATQFVRRADWLKADDVNTARSISLKIAGGTELTGYLTLPKQPRLKLAPLIVLSHDGPWDRDLPGYNREAQALASAGFAVWQVNYRGSAGFGRAFSTALKTAIDRIPLSDILTSVDEIALHYPVDKQRLGLFGRGFGGYLSLRGLQLYPNRFRSAVSIDAPTDLVWWRDGGATMAEREVWSRESALNNLEESVRADAAEFGGHGTELIRQEIAFDLQMRGSADSRPASPSMRTSASTAGWRAFLAGDKRKLAAISPLFYPESLKSPVMLIQDPQDTEVTLGPGRKLRDALRHEGAAINYQEITGAYINRTPEASAAVLNLAAAFFNLTLYDFGTKTGEIKSIGISPE